MTSSFEKSSFRDVVVRGKSQTNYPMPTEKEELRIIFDGGNNRLKIMIDKHFRNEVDIPQQLVEIDEQEFRAIQARYSGKSMPSGTSIFFDRTTEKGYIIGEDAQLDGRSTQVHGRSKYTRELMGKHLVAGLLQVYPRSHKNIKILVLHPSDLHDKDFENIQSSIGGLHKIETVTGEKISYGVRAMRSLPESTGGFLAFMLSEKGEVKANLPKCIQPDGEYVIVDIGGWISMMSVARTDKHGRVSISASGLTPINFGIQHIIDQLQGTLRREINELSNVQTIKRSVLDNVLMTGKLDLYNTGDTEKMIDCTSYVGMAMGQIERELKTRYTQQLNNGIGYGAIVFSGGGGGVSEPYLSRFDAENTDPMMNGVFANHAKNGSVFRAMVDPDRMIYSNIVGASKGWEN